MVYVTPGKHALTCVDNAARAVPDHSPDDLYRPYRIAGDDNTSGGWETDAGRDATGHVFHGWRQCGIHGGADVDHAL